MDLNVEGTAYDTEDPGDARGGFAETAIRAQLERLQHSRAFARSHRLLHLLVYLVEHSQTDSDRDLQESIIGIEHFRRGSDFDCQKDTIVRVNARRLRDRLAEYYLDEGAADPIRFEIPKGRYRVLFHSGAALPAPSPPVPLPVIDADDLTSDTAASSPAMADALAAQEAPSAAPRSRRWPFYPVAAFVVVLAAAVGLPVMSPWLLNISNGFSHSTKTSRTPGSVSPRAFACSGWRRVCCPPRRRWCGSSPPCAPP